MAVDETLEDLLAELDAGHLIPGGSPLHQAMHRQSQEAIRIATELNGTYHDEAGVRALLSELVGYEVDATVGLFPPFTSDFGRNIRFGKNVFVNSGCRFQDQGGITLGDGVLIGHNTVIATLNHAMDPARRADLEPAPVVIGKDVWVGSSSTIVPGVTIGDGAVIGAGSVVTKDVPAGMVAVGSPAKVVREVLPGNITDCD